MNRIDIKSDISTKASPDCKTIKFKAVAGVSDAELVKRYTIGEYREDAEENKEAEGSTSD